MDQFLAQVSTEIDPRGIFGMEWKKLDIRWSGADMDLTGHAALPDISDQDEFYAGT
jgi:hypothetical protein